jgi:DHA1 family multidrug resistance protein-like MFS transporter
MTSHTTAPPKTFEWWMLSMFALGISYSAFVSLLIPPYVSDAGGDASTAGIVMAIIALGALGGPPIGAFADRYSAHRLVMVSGIAGMSLSFAAYALSADNSALYALDAILMGVSVAAVSATAPVFIVGAKLDQETEAKQMTTLQLMMPAGQLVGGLLLAVVAGWTFANRFWLGAIIVSLSFVVVWFTTGDVSERLKTAMAEDVTTDDDGGRKKIGLSKVLLSTFGIYFAVLVFTSVANNGVNAQIANIMPNVYGVDAKTTSALISLAGLLNILLYFPAGRWMARKGPFPPFMAGVVGRMIAGLGMGAVGLMTDNKALLGAAFMQLMYQTAPFVRLAQPGLAVRFATFPAGQASGWVIAGSAIGSFVGSLLGGYLADTYGYNAVNWMAGVAGAGAALILFIWLRPAERRMREGEKAPPDAPSNDQEAVRNE